MCICTKSWPKRSCLSYLLSSVWKLEHPFIHAQISKNKLTHSYSHKHTYINTHKQMYKYANTWIHIFIHTHIHTHTRTHKHKHTHKHIHSVGSMLYICYPLFSPCQKQHDMHDIITIKLLYVTLTLCWILILLFTFTSLTSKSWLWLCKKICHHKMTYPPCSTKKLSL